ncbi:MAG: hypothetical protein KDE19_09380, partial [Caldilineaceae bacterium]|nr:hypothetical protein [Caldilineaceae bacterium]
ILQLHPIQEHSIDLVTDYLVHCKNSKLATETQNSQKDSPVNFCGFCVFVAIRPFLQWTQYLVTKVAGRP